MAEAEAETQIKHQQVARWRGAQKARLDGSRPGLVRSCSALGPADLRDRVQSNRNAKAARLAGEG